MKKPVELRQDGPGVVYVSQKPYKNGVVPNPDGNRAERRAAKRVKELMDE